MRHFKVQLVLLRNYPFFFIVENDLGGISTNTNFILKVLVPYFLFNNWYMLYTIKKKVAFPI
jgi:hypothetical protein